MGHSARMRTRPFFTIVFRHSRNCFISIFSATTYNRCRTEWRWYLHPSKFRCKPLVLSNFIPILNALVEFNLPSGGLGSTESRLRWTYQSQLSWVWWDRYFRAPQSDEPLLSFPFRFMNNMTTSLRNTPKMCREIKRWSFHERKVFSECIDLMPHLPRSLFFFSPFWERREQIEYCVTYVNSVFVMLRYRRLTFRQFSRRRAKWSRPDVMTSLLPSLPGGRITARLRMITWSMPRSWRQARKQCWLSQTRTDTKVWSGHVWIWLNDKFVGIPHNTKSFVFHF